MVRKNELISEFYEFDEGGRRVLDFRAWAGGKRRLTYNYDGTLIQAGNVHLKWTEQGQLAAIEDGGKRTSFYYGHDTRLDRALLADGTDIRYHYGNELMPVKITVNGTTVAEYQWADKIRLLRYRDARRGLSHDFLYADKRAPVKVIISGSAVDLYQATGISAQRLELDIQTDQVDSIRTLSLPDGRPVKYIEYDSFGNVISDSRHDWQFPLGFACGLHDHWTGLIRFGFRDYDPRFGRFTARDPIGDTGGDHDLWDYCVDDPVSYNDPSGLFVPLLLLGGMFGSLGLGLAGAYGAAKVTDAIKTKRDGKESTVARDGVRKVAPTVYQVHTNSFLPGQIALGGATTGVGRVLGGKAIFEYVKHGVSDTQRTDE